VGRTTAEHERVIDALDDLITFCYAYEGEISAKGDLGRLQALAAEVHHSLAKNLNIYRLLQPREKESIIISVMNGLQSAIHNKATPEEVDFGLAWANKPSVLTVLFLSKVHNEQFSDILQFMTDVLGRLNTSFPPEAKQFITLQQVMATVQAMLRIKQESFAAPIHVDTLSGLLHQYFLMELTLSDPASADPRRWQKMTQKYMEQAAGKLVEMVEAAFVTAMIRKLFPSAQKLHISIDRYYPWGALWKLPMAGKDLLDLYAGLNLSGAVADKKFNCQSVESTKNSVPAAEFFRWVVDNCPRATESSRATANQIYLDTDRVDIRIDGKSIQKYAVMAIRYDKPLRSVEKYLMHFGVYLHTQRQRHCANGQEPRSNDEFAMAQQLAVDAISQRKATRTVLHDKSSVLGHICALTYLQMNRDPHYADALNKVRIPDIVKLVKTAGFEFTEDSIRKACSKRDTQLATTMLRLANA
jgi:hypothetical protein